MKNEKIMEVENDQGVKIQLEVIDKFKVDGKDYVVVCEKGKDNANAFRLEEKNGIRDFISIGSGAEFRKVLEEYGRRNN